MKASMLKSVMLLAACLLIVSCAPKAGDTAKSGTNAGAGAATGSTAGTPAGTGATGGGAASQAKQWAKAPDMQIDPNKSYEAVVATSKGQFTISLLAKDAPNTVNNFVFLSREGFYNGVTFHRIIKEFMIQTGDPTGTGRGGPGYKFEDELSSKYPYDPGTVAMANSGPNTNGSQFFVCTENCSHLNKKPAYSVFGQIKEGMDVVLAIAASPVKPNTTSPAEDIVIKSVTITEK